MKSRWRHNWKLAQVVNSQQCATPQSGNRVSTSLGNSGLCWTIFTRNRDTAVPAEGNGELQTRIGVLVARPRRCPTLSNPVPRQNWMAAYLGYTLRMKTLFRGWPVVVHDTHTRRRLTLGCYYWAYTSVKNWLNFGDVSVGRTMCSVKSYKCSKCSLSALSALSQVHNPLPLVCSPSIIHFSKSAHKFALRVCQVTTVATEITQLVLSQFKNF